MITKTNTLLLEQLTDPEQHAAWEEFDGRYRPVLRAFAGRLGLQSEDAEEAAQVTLTRFVEYYRRGHFDRSRGRLRSWIFSIAQNVIRDLHNGARRRGMLRGESAYGELVGADGLGEIFEAEWRRAVTRAGLEELRRGTQTDPQTLKAFELLALEEWSAAQVAEELGMTTNAVYVAKHRAIQRLRTILASLEETF